MPGAALLRQVVNLPEAVCDGGILFYIHRKVQKVLIFAAYLKRDESTSKEAKSNQIKILDRCDSLISY